MAISLAVKISGNIDPLLKSLRRAERSMNKFSRNMTRVGKTLTTSLTLPIAGLGFLAGKTFAEFEQSMAKVKAISGATGDEFKKLEKLALDLGASTRYTASQVAELQLNYSKLGFSSDEIQKITGATLDLALATGEDLAQSATVAGATLRGFGLDASQMGVVVNTMAEAFSSSALDLEKFQTAMATVAPVAKNAGFSIQETTSMLGVLANRGMDASTAGTSLRNIFLELSKTGLTFKEAMDKINTSTNVSATALDMFGKRGSTAAVILSATQQETAKLATKLDKAKTSAKDMAEIMDDTMQGALFRMKSAVEGMGIAFGEILAPTVTKVAAGVAKLATWFKDLEPATKKIITVVAGLVAGLGPLLFIIGKIPGILAAIIGGMVGLIGQFKKLALFLVVNPWVAVASAVAIATAGLLKYAAAAKTAKDRQIDLNNTMDDARKTRDKQLVVQFKELGTHKELQDKFYNGWKDTWWKYVEQAKKAQAEGNAAAAKHFWVLADKTHELIEQFDKIREAGKVSEVIIPEFDKITTATDKANTALDNYIARMVMLQSGEFVGPTQPTTMGGFGPGGGVTPLTPQPVVPPTLGNGIDIMITKVETLTDKVNNFKDAFNTIADGAGGIFSRVKGMFNKIGDLALEIANKFKKGWKNAFELIASITADVVGMIGDILNESHQRDLDRLNEKQERERERIENSLLSEDQKAKALHKLDKDAEKKRKEIAREQAKDAKAIAIIQAIIAGALAVVTALSMMPPPAGVALAIIVGALAAIQIGVILSQPLPALAEGGLAYAPTMAMVGDNPNARLDPEVIAPLSKLKAFMGEGKPVEVYGILSGETILLSSKRAADSRNRTRGTYGS